MSPEDIKEEAIDLEAALAGFLSQLVEAVPLNESVYKSLARARMTLRFINEAGLDEISSAMRLELP